MWVLIKAILDMSLSLIRLGVTTYQQTRPHGKKGSRTPQDGFEGSRGEAEKKGKKSLNKVN